MRGLPFTDPELNRIYGTCAAIHIDECTPPYLQDFIAARLADDFPELSTKVRRLDGTEMDDLCAKIKASSRLT